MYVGNRKFHQMSSSTIYSLLRLICGKGTQCERIVCDFGFLHLSVGDLLRDEVKKGIDVGKNCEKLMKEGLSVPIEVTVELFKKAMKQGIEKAKRYFNDEFPHAIHQAQGIEKKVT